jgi:LuxR family maltose regulon positive regulatory protein
MTDRRGDVDLDVDSSAGVASGDIAVVIGDLRSAASAGDGDAAARIVRRAWFDLLLQGARVRPVVESLPPEELGKHPLLLAMLAIFSYADPHGRPRALRLFHAAARAARGRRRELAALDRALVLVSEGVGHRLLGHPEAGVAPTLEAIQALDSLDDLDRRTVPYLSRVYAQAGTSLYYAGREAEALDTFRKGLAEGYGAIDSPSFGNLAMLAGVHAFRGEIEIATSYLELARGERWTDTNRSMYTGTFYRLAEAMVLLERFDPVGAQAQLDAMVHDERTIEHWLPIAAIHALIRLVAGDPGAALSGLDSAVSRRADTMSPLVRARLAPVRAVLQLASGRPDSARGVVRNDLPPGPARHLEAARVELALGHAGAALHELRSLPDDMPLRLLADSAAVEAAALLRLRASPRVGAVVGRLGSLLRMTGQRLVLGLLGPADLEAVRGALVSHGYGDLFDDISVRSLMHRDPDAPVLTEREVVVLRALLRTGSAADIASELVVSRNTVKSQLRSLYRKLGASTRDEAIAIAIDRHLLHASTNDGRSSADRDRSDEAEGR